MKHVLVRVRGVPRNVVFQAPDGWAIDPDGSGRYVTIERPRVGFAQVDFETRCFRAGIVYHGKPIGKHGLAAYRGRGWSERLGLDAIAWLHGLDG